MKYVVLAWYVSGVLFSLVGSVLFADEIRVKDLGWCLTIGGMYGPLMPLRVLAAISKKHMLPHVQKVLNLSLYSRKK